MLLSQFGGATTPLDSLYRQYQRNSPNWSPERRLQQGIELSIDLTGDSEQLDAETDLLLRDLEVLALQLGDSTAYARVLVSRGWLELYRGNADVALSALYTARDLLLNDRSSPAALLEVYMGLGAYFSEQDSSVYHFTQAVDYFRRAIELAEELGDGQTELSARYNLAVTHSVFGRYAEARPLYADVQERYRRHGAPIDRADVYLNLAADALKQLDPSLAAPALDSVATLYRRHADLPGPMDRAYYAQLRGVYLSQSGQWDRAEELLRRAIAAFRADHQPVQAVPAYDDLVDHYERAGQLRRALTTLREREALQDSLSRLANERLLTTLETQLRVGEQRQHIAELRRQRRYWQIGGAGLTLLAILTSYLYVRKRRLNRKLDQQNREISRMAAARDRLYLNLSHELRTPLTLMTVPVHQLLEDQNLSDDHRRKLKDVATAATALERSMDGLIQFSKLDHRLLSVHPVVVSVGSWAEAVVATFRPAAQRQEIDLRLTEDVPEEQLWLDEEKVTTIVNNLLANALQYARGASRIELRVGADAGAVYMEVTDDGEGIPEVDRERVFDRFYRGTEQGQQGGSGIGLAYSRELAHLMGGSLSLRAGFGRGCRFVLELPRTDPAPASAPETPSAAHSPAGNIRILVAEDHPGIRRLIAETLTAYGQVLTVADGAAAWELLAAEEEGGFDLLVTDLMMPRVEGRELLRRIEQLPPARQPATVVVTARRDEQLKLDVLRTGVSDYMIKPFLPAELRARVETLLSYRRIRRKAVIDHEPPAAADSEFVLVLRKLVSERLGEPDFGADAMAAGLYTSRRGLYRKLKEQLGLTPGEFLREMRLEKACELLETDPDVSLKELSATVGFRTAHYFSKLFRERFGCHPQDYANKQGE
jgi:signal transduction histidine kinase/DNA-binding response OmpR family regulator